MKKKLLLRGVVWTCWSGALFASWHFLGVWLAPDACLDHGGSFNYELWKCSGDINTFIDVAAYEMPSFWFAASCFVVALLVHVYARRAQPGVQAGRAKARPLT